MTIEQMRTYVAERYPGKEWKHRVKCMPDSQVMAIYYRFEKSPVKKEVKPEEKPGEKYEQLMMDI